MPEGDTIYRAAAALRTALIGKKMTRFEAPRLTSVLPRIGQTIEEVMFAAGRRDFARQLKTQFERSLERANTL